MTRPAPTVTDHPSALVSVPETVIAACEGEQEHFEDWAKSSRYDMSEHPLHYIFMDPKTDAARMGWNAALAYVRNNTAAPAAPQAAGVGEDELKAIARIIFPESERVKMDREWGGNRNHSRTRWKKALEQAKEILAIRAPSREPEGGAAHYGDPCVKCGIGHDNVPQGPCRGDGITISRERANALLDYLKNGRGPAGWPTTLWCEVQAFIKNVEAALATREEAPAEAGELAEAMNRLAEDAENEAGLGAGMLGGARIAADIRTVLSALRAQPPAREATTPSPLGGASVGPDEAEEASSVDATPQAAQQNDLGTQDLNRRLEALQAHEDAQPVGVTIFCPNCALPHVDEGEWATTRRHKTHQCQGCGHEWRPFPFATVGVAHPAPDALRVAVEALEYIDNNKSIAPVWVQRRVRQALAALQAEQKGGAA